MRSIGRAWSTAQTNVFDLRLEGTITTLAERTVEYEQKLAERQASMGEIQAESQQHNSPCNGTLCGPHRLRGDPVMVLLVDIGAGEARGDDRHATTAA